MERVPLGPQSISEGDSHPSTFANSRQLRFYIHLHRKPNCLPQQARICSKTQRFAADRLHSSKESSSQGARTSEHKLSDCRSSPKPRLNSRTGQSRIIVSKRSRFPVKRQSTAVSSLSSSSNGTVTAHATHQFGDGTNKPSKQTTICSPTDRCLGQNERKPNE